MIFDSSFVHRIDIAVGSNHDYIKKRNVTCTLSVKSWNVVESLLFFTSLKLFQRTWNWTQILETGCKKISLNSTPQISRGEAHCFTSSDRNTEWRCLKKCFRDGMDRKRSTNVSHERQCDTNRIMIWEGTNCDSVQRSCAVQRGTTSA